MQCGHLYSQDSGDPGAGWLTGPARTGELATLDKLGGSVKDLASISKRKRDEEDAEH